MECIVRARRGGKTQELVRRAKLDPTMAILVATEPQRQFLIAAHPEVKSRVFTTRDFRNGAAKGCEFDTLAIDNLDMLLNDVLNTRLPIQLVTVTGEVV